MFSKNFTLPSGVNIVSNVLSCSSLHASLDTFTSSGINPLASPDFVSATTNGASSILLLALAVASVKVASTSNSSSVCVANTSTPLAARRSNSLRLLTSPTFLAPITPDSTSCNISIGDLNPATLVE